MQTPCQITGGDFGIVLGVEIDPFAAQLLAQTEVVGQRAVVHQAQVGARGKRVAAFHGHGTFGGHAGVADDVAAFHAAQAEALRDLLRQAHSLEDFDALARAHDAHGRRQFTQRGTHCGFFSLDLQDDGAGVLEPVQRRTELAFKRCDQRLEIVVFSGRLQGQLDPAIAHFIAVDSKTCAVRTAIGHGFEHRLEELAELGFQRRVFEIKTYDSTHIHNSWAEDAQPIGRRQKRVC